MKANTWTAKCCGLVLATVVASTSFGLSTGEAQARDCDNILRLGLAKGLGGKSGDIIFGTGAGMAVLWDACTGPITALAADKRYRSTLAKLVGLPSASLKTEASLKAWRRSACGVLQGMGGGGSQAAASLGGEARVAAMVDRMTLQSGFTYLAQWSLSRSIVQRWRACKAKQPGFSCYALADGDLNTVGFVANWNGGQWESPTIGTATYRNVENNPKPGGKVYRQGDRVRGGSAAADFNIVNTNQPATVILGYQDKTKTPYFCSALSTGFMVQGIFKDDPSKASEFYAKALADLLKDVRYNRTSSASCEKIQSKVEVARNAGEMDWKAVDRRYKQLLSQSSVSALRYQSDKNDEFRDQYLLAVDMLKEGERLGCLRY